MIPAETIEEIKNKLDIVSVISAYVPLKKKGRNHLGLCPFHNEKTPSFTVSPEKDLWHCFGCGAGGNSLSFIMKIENLSFVESVKLLGEKVGVAVRDEMTASYKHIKEKKDILYALVRKAAIFFQNKLQAEQGIQAKEYLKNRGLSEEIVARFKLGYVVPEWDSLLKQLAQAGHSPELLEEAGLVIKREEGNGHYDRFRGRLIFTVTDTRDRPVAFGGRIMSEVQNEPKYLNSPETAIFNKGRLLYGLPQAQKAMRESKAVILTEGYMDTLTCHQFGFANTVATLGTAMTADQAKLLARYVQKVILAYDADQAGQLATERGIDILRGAGLDIKVAYLKGKDPDEMLRSEGKDAFAKAIKDAVPYIRFLLDRAFKDKDLNSPEGKNKAAEAAVDVLQTIKQDILRSEYVKYASEVLQLKEDVLLATLNRSRYYKQNKNDKLKVSGWLYRPSSKQIKAEETLLKAMLEDQQMRESLLQKVAEVYVASDIHKILLQDIAKHHNVAGYDWLEMIKDVPAQKLARKLLLQEEPWTEKTIADCLEVLKQAHQQKRKKVLHQELKTAEAAGDDSRAKELLVAIQKNI